MGGKKEGARLGNEGERGGTNTLGEKRGGGGTVEHTVPKDVKTFDVPQLLRFSIKSDFRRARPT